MKAWGGEVTDNVFYLTSSDCIREVFEMPIILGFAYIRIADVPIHYILDGTYIEHQFGNNTYLFVILYFQFINTHCTAVKLP